jgi:hypothetical protein
MTSLKSPYRISVAVLATIMIAASTATAQTIAATQGFSFKGNPLGMTLEQFKASNPETPCFTSSQVDAPMGYQPALVAAQNIADGARINLIGLKINVHRAKGKDAKKDAMLAYDVGVYNAQKAQAAFIALRDQGPPPDAPWMVLIAHKAGEITCSSCASMVVSQFSSYGDTNPNVLKIGSTSVNGVAYLFLNARLYKVVIMGNPEVFTNLKDAFTSRFGEPAATSSDEYQNAFGARWQGANLAWTKGSQAITLHEGSGNGPAQTSMLSVTYEDQSLEPVPAKVTTDF